AELDDRDGLPGPVGAGRELVEARNLWRGQRSRFRAGLRRRGPRGRARLRRDRLPGGGRPPELRAGLRPVVEAEHGGDDAGQFGGAEDAGRPAPGGARWVTVPPSGSGLEISVSVVPNAIDSASIVPLTFTLRDSGLDSVTVSPYRPSTPVTSATSAGSEPYWVPSSAEVNVSGP